MEASAWIFLSYAREDEGKVEDLYQRLSDAGFRPWMDKKDILPGEIWRSSIEKAIRCSDFFLACVSANSVNKRGFLQREIKEALDIWQEMLDSDIYLIPVRLEDCTVSESLRDSQWVDLFEEDGWSQLVRAIQIGMERRRAGTESIVEERPGRAPLRAPSAGESEWTLQKKIAFAGVIVALVVGLLTCTATIAVPIVERLVESLLPRPTERIGIDIEIKATETSMPASETPMSTVMPTSTDTRMPTGTPTPTGTPMPPTTIPTPTDTPMPTPTPVLTAIPSPTATCTPAPSPTPTPPPSRPPPPVITGLDPGATKHNCPVQVTIRGEWLRQSTSVRLIGPDHEVFASEIQVIDDSQIKCKFDLLGITVPWTQEWKLQVEGPGGTAEYDFFVAKDVPDDNEPYP